MCLREQILTDMKTVLRSKTSKHGALARLISGLSVLAFVAGCATEPVKVVQKTKAKSKEYFSEVEYGVKASPRVIAAALHLPGVRSRMPRGGGREQIGKPYKIRGKWYYPKEDFGYNRKGTASWYGDAFHGRKTANGEVYDMQQLSAAHPTMPLPSYAKVTNLKNGNSVIVRVNDRGPYAHNRLIDMSKRAAQLLDYTSSGTAQVQVTYVGRAPVNGNDDQYLMASFRPGDGGAVPGDAMQPNIMVAMAGPTPRSQAFNQEPIFEGEQPVVAAMSAQDPFALMEDATIPHFGPVVPDKPYFDPMTGAPAAARGEPMSAGILVSSYASERVASAYSVDSPFSVMGLSEKRIQASWKDKAGSDLSLDGEYVLLGSFSSDEAKRLSSEMAGFGRITEEKDGENIALSLRADGRMDIDALLEKSWKLGANDAFVVRE